MKVTSISTHRFCLPFARPMITAHGRYDNRLFLFVRVESIDGAVGWGECSSLEDTAYFWENVETAEQSIVQSVVPALQNSDADPRTIAADLRTKLAIGPMSAQAVEMAVLDCELRATGESLKSYLGRSGDRVPVTIDMGIPADRSIATLMQQVEMHVESGVRAIKLKIEPGWDVDPVEIVRAMYSPERLSIIVDANESFAGKDQTPLFRLSDLQTIIEQPLARDDFAGHAKLLRDGVTSICLDESIEEPEDAERALAMHAATMLSLKPSRLGGTLKMDALQRRCADLGLTTRVGAMYLSAKGATVERVLSLGQAPSANTPFGLRWRGGVDLVAADAVDVNGMIPASNEVGIGPEITPSLMREFEVPSQS